jgi:hypothetical protein
MILSILKELKCPITETKNEIDLVNYLKYFYFK